ncbi:hypothetical protein [Capnocytophaga periodontitidis]|uniref:hypothetical protein n=1 Tax=Capnocytophaga periodontitidis TaxID=2795027 RepID=UPI0018E1B250|nr:hypothetical protein [Capnocytophaga periodontitidis]MBI1669489.1 hypothetical protein [Capnocytophaga periodontitidis]
MQKYILIILLLLAACSGKKEVIDDRYIIFNLYTSKKVPSHSITLDFKDKSIFIHNIADEGIFEFNPPPPPPSYNIKWTSAYSIYPKGKVIDNKISQKTDKLFIKINNILNDGQPFSCSNHPPMPDEYVYISFTYFKDNQLIYSCFRPTQKELDIFNLVRDFILTNDTVNADKWKLFYDK